MGMIKFHPNYKPKKGAKVKHRTAENAKVERELRASWDKLLKVHGLGPIKKRRVKKFVEMKVSPTRQVLDQQQAIGKLPLPSGSRPDPVAVDGVQTAKRDMVYTGSEMDLATMHKSNTTVIPREDKELRIEYAKMRRNNNG